jgi:hypothetical protein
MEGLQPVDHMRLPRIGVDRTVRHSGLIRVYRIVDTHKIGLTGCWMPEQDTRMT